MDISLEVHCPDVEPLVSVEVGTWCVLWLYDVVALLLGYGGGDVLLIVLEHIRCPWLEVPVVVGEGGLQVALCPDHENDGIRWVPEGVQWDDDLCGADSSCEGWDSLEPL